MATEWFYQQGSEQIGPVSANQIRSLAKVGVIVPGTPIRKSDDAHWTKAARIKGLFDGVETVQRTAEAQDEKAPDPLVALASHAASSVASAAGSAASAVGGAVSGFLARRKEKQSELAKAPAPTPPASSQATLNWLDALTRDNQSPEVVTKLVEKVRAILMSDEQLTYVAVQNKPIVNLKPDCIALTNKRFIFYRPKLLGRVDFEDYVWRELHDAQLSENIVGSTFSIKTMAGGKLSLNYLPKSQARAVYRIAQAMEERSLEERRTRSIEEMRAAAGAVVVQANLGVQTPTTPPIAIENNDPMQKLQQLKSLLNAGLISAAEYDAKKADILSRI